MTCNLHERLGRNLIAGASFRCICRGLAGISFRLFVGIGLFALLLGAAVAGPADAYVRFFVGGAVGFPIFTPPYAYSYPYPAVYPYAAYPYPYPYGAYVGYAAPLPAGWVGGHWVWRRGPWGSQSTCLGAGTSSLSEWIMASTRVNIVAVCSAAAWTCLSVLPAIATPPLDSPPPPPPPSSAYAIQDAPPVPPPPPYYYYGPPPAVPVVVQSAPPPLSPAARVIYAPFYATGLVLRYGFYYLFVAPFEVLGRALVYGVEGGVPPREEHNEAP